MNGGAVELRTRQRRILQRLWREGALSRQELHRKLRAHPNLVGRDVAELIQLGLLCEGPSAANGRGRPSIPVQVDRQRRSVLGLALTPGAVNVGRLTLGGERLEPARSRQVSHSTKLVPIAARLLEEALDENTLSIGVTSTGLLDPRKQELLLSSAIPGRRGVPLSPILKAAGNVPMVLRNDMHALAARWSLGPAGAAGEDILIVSLGDGRVGSAMLIDGHINRGCLLGANELGHMRFPIQTPLCFCGHRGCLERVFSSEYLRLSSRRHAPLDAALSASRLTAASGRVLEIASHGIANVVNFVRPDRLIITGVPGSEPTVFDRLVPGVREKILAGLVDRVHIERWAPPTTGAGETAAWLAIATWFLPQTERAWGETTVRNPRVRH